MERLGLDLAALKGDLSVVGDVLYRDCIRDVRGGSFGALILVLTGLVLCSFPAMPLPRCSTLISPCPDDPANDALY